MTVCVYTNLRLQAVKFRLVIGSQILGDFSLRRCTCRAGAGITDHLSRIYDYSVIQTDRAGAGIAEHACITDRFFITMLYFLRTIYVCCDIFSMT